MMSIRNDDASNLAWLEREKAERATPQPEDRFSALRAGAAKPGGVIGCGECDPDFPCYNTPEVCFRLPPEGEAPAAAEATVFAEAEPECQACLLKLWQEPTICLRLGGKTLCNDCASGQPTAPADLAEDYDLQAGGPGMSLEEAQARYSAPSKGINPKDAAALDRVPFHIYPPAGHVLGTMACLDGAIKYGPYNWRERDISLTQYVGAIIRHCQKILGGEDIDPESTFKLPHLAHVNATSAILLDAEKAGALIDDRPKRQVDCAALITECNALIKAHNQGTK